MSEATPKQEKNTQSADMQAFVGRLTSYEFGFVNDKNRSPLRSLEGSFLKKYEIANYFKDTVYSETGITNRKIGTHLLKYYVDDKLSELVSARQKASQEKTKESNDQRDEAGEALILEMQAILSNPEQYGVDIEKQHTSRHELQYVSESGEDDGYETLNALLADEENVPDPFYINGMLPRTEVLSDACKRIYEKWYPANEGDDHTARLLIKERCIDQLIRELDQVEQNRTKDKVSPKDKPALIDKKVQKLTILMRQLSKQEYLNAYLDVIAFGSHHSGSSKLPDDMLQLDTLTKRTPFNFAKQVDEGPERTERRIAFYRNMYTNIDASEQGIAIEEFDDGKNTFFKDNAGQISPASAYAKMEMIFRLKGFTDEEISQSCAAYMGEVVTKMVDFEKKYKDLLSRRETVKTNAELIELNKQIKQMQGDGRGQLRKEVLAEAKKVVTNLEYIRVAPIESDGDNLAKLDNATNGIENGNQSIFAFNYDTLGDRDSRIIEGEEFIERVDALLQESLDSATGNVVAQDDDYIKLRDEYPLKRKELTELLGNETDPAQKSVSAIVKGIESNVNDMIAKIEAATVILETEASEVAHSAVTA